jgi:eukaryotic-like serine/threonine-protein kinase
MTDSNARWSRVNELFHAAVAIPPTERDAFLSAQCGADAALRGEVESLLLVHRDDDSRMTSPLRPGSRIGDYEITGFIASGGMGDVYRAHDTRLGRNAALKVLPSALVSDPDRRARFEREARTLASLTHPHIATIYGVEEADGVSALALELVDGETLADRIARGRLPVDEALRIAKQIAEALETAHEHAIVHRDLKPANVKISRDGVVKVLDFGLAKLADDAVARGVPEASAAVTLPHMTGVGVILGTPAYMSPEQARGEPADQRSDIWAFGCVLYEMLTGQPAFSAKTVPDTLARVLASEPNFDALPKDVPDTVRTVIARCLAKDRVRRIPHASVIRFLLDETHATRRDDSWRAWTLQLLQDRNSRVVVIVALVFVIPAVSGVVRTIVLSRPTARQPVSGAVNDTALRLELLSPADTTFVSTSLSVSPDGHWLAFETNEALRVRDLTSGETRTLTDIQVTGRRLFWSPDSRSVAFFDDGKLQTIEIGAGSKPRTVVNNAPTADGGTWNSTATILFTGPTGQANAVMRVNVDGSDMRPVTTLAVDRGETAHLWPSFLPDGNHFLYLALNKDPTKNALYLATLNGSIPIRVSGIDGEAKYAEPGFLVYARGGSLIARRFDGTNATLSGDEISLATDGLFNSRDGSAAFSVSRAGMLVYVSGPDNGQRVLTWFDRVGNRVGSVGEPADYSNFRLSPDGKRVAEDRGRIKDRHLWIRDIDRGTSTRLTFGDSVEKAPAWSPDGTQVLFTKESTRPKTEIRSM